MPIGVQPCLALSQHVHYFVATGLSRHHLFLQLWAEAVEGEVQLCAVGPASLCHHLRLQELVGMGGRGGGDGRVDEVGIGGEGGGDGGVRRWGWKMEVGMRSGGGGDEEWRWG